MSFTKKRFCHTANTCSERMMFCKCCTLPFTMKRVFLGLRCRKDVFYMPVRNQLLETLQIMLGDD
jgi:hypothetical protein